MEEYRKYLENGIKAPLRQTGGVHDGRLGAFNVQRDTRVVVDRRSPHIRSSLEMTVERETNDANVIGYEEHVKDAILVQLRIAVLLDALRRSHRTPIVPNLRNQVNVDGQRCVARVPHVNDRLELADLYSGEGSGDVRAVAVGVSDSMNEYSSEITGRNISSSWIMRYEFA